MQLRTALRARKRGQKHLAQWYLKAQTQDDGWCMTIITDDPGRYASNGFEVVAHVLALNRYDAASAFADAGYLDWNDIRSYRGLTDRNVDLGVFRP